MSSALSLKPLAIGAVSAASFLLSGCTTPASKTPEAREYIYYPPRPAVSRYQYLTSFSSDEDLKGKGNSFSSFIVGEDPEVTTIIKPYGIAVHDSTLYVCDTIAFSIDIVDLKSGGIRRFRPQGEGRLGKPINIAIDEDGTRYVADTAWGMVLIYGPDDRFLGSIGTRGETKPSDVVIHGDRLYVTDLTQKAVKVLDKQTHEELFRIPREDDVPESELFSPVNIAVGDDGRIFVSDLGSFSVTIFNPEGFFEKRVGDIGTQIGGMVRPKGIAVDRDGRFYVVDAATEVVQVFDPKGRLLLFFGEPAGSDVGLVLPAKVMIDYDHTDLFKKFVAPDFNLEYLVFVTSQYGPRKVSVFGFGSREGDPAKTGLRSARPVR